jgi:hypothetical protein
MPEDIVYRSNNSIGRGRRRCAEDSASGAVSQTQINSLSSGLNLGELLMAPGTISSNLSVRVRRLPDDQADCRQCGRTSRDAVAEPGQRLRAGLAALQLRFSGRL